MILTDANIWIDHFRSADPHLFDLADVGRVLMHPYTVAEVGLGSFANRDEVIDLLESLPPAPVALHDEVMTFITSNGLAGTGIGYVDCHLLASARLIGGKLWTRDKRLLKQAVMLALDYPAPAPH